MHIEIWLIAMSLEEVETFNLKSLYRNRRRRFHDLSHIFLKTTELQDTGPVEDNLGPIGTHDVVLRRCPFHICYLPTSCGRSRVGRRDFLSLTSKVGVAEEEPL